MHCLRDEVVLENHTLLRFAEFGKYYILVRDTFSGFKYHIRFMGFKFGSLNKPNGVISSAR